MLIDASQRSPVLSKEGVHLFLDKWPRRGEGLPHGIFGDLETVCMAERLR